MRAIESNLCSLKSAVIEARSRIKYISVLWFVLVLVAGKTSVVIDTKHKQSLSHGSVSHVACTGVG